MNVQLKPGFLLGAATSATQIEGGDRNNNWYDWYRRGYIKDNADPAVATEHYRLWQQDLELMAQMGLQCCRFGVEWSRIEPQEGIFDEAAIAHYREEIQAMVDRGIRPLLTLHHFSNPLWLEEKGAFLDRGNITYFLRFVHKMVLSVGDLVSEYITINEPNVYAFNSYFDGSWPPGRRDLAAMSQVLTNLAAAHIEAYGLIRKTRLEMGYTDTKVSFAAHLRVFTPRQEQNPLHRFWCNKAEQIFQGGMLRAMCLGETAFPIRRHPAIVPGRYCDFHALNYYTRSTISGPTDGVARDCPVSDLGWEIYPQGIAETAQLLYDTLPRPIWVTENGVCDNFDRYRARYIAEHLKALMDSDLPVERYYHWCFCDNWEWVEGNSARFGLVYVEHPSQRRLVKRSGEFYRQVIARGGVDEELWRQYCTTPYNAK